MCVCVFVCVVLFYMLSYVDVCGFVGLHIDYTVVCVCRLLCLRLCVWLCGDVRVVVCMSPCVYFGFVCRCINVGVVPGRIYDDDCYGTRVFVVVARVGACVRAGVYVSVLF